MISINIIIHRKRGGGRDGGSVPVHGVRDGGEEIRRKWKMLIKIKHGKHKSKGRKWTKREEERKLNLR